MLPTFVIGLREGLEAALIVGIIAAFLLQENRRDAMRGVWIGVGIAVTLCLAAAVGLRLASEQLPQREQEQLETIIGLVAVGMVTWMIVWMRRHAANLRGALQEQASAALATGSTAALVTMAFLAVLREGLETAVFLLAVFQDAEDPALSGGGAALGILAAVVLGYLLYRGGVRINLTRFFKITGVVLALVAAGLLATAVHTAHEAGWWNIMQAQAVDLSWLVKPGTVQFALITAMFGIQPKPTTGELFAWLLYAVPMVAYVLTTPKPRVQPATEAPASVPADVALDAPVTQS
ncbi:MAG TPA: iron uptake transporter permease EfeU [Acidimicrobiia bacterium]|nr:iron uptake transporter permease EfeU [Acidimicrobiia bacterium]